MSHAQRDRAPKYLKRIWDRPRGWRSLIQRPPEIRFLAWNENRKHQAVSSDGLWEYLGVPPGSGARRDVYFCIERATEIREAGDTESWIEIPTGRAVRLP